VCTVHDFQEQCQTVLIAFFLLDSSFVMSRIHPNEGLGKCYQPWPSAWLITLTLTLIIPDITKASSNNYCLFILLPWQDMFHNLTPVSGGIGMKLLEKMGWKPGQVIGKRGEGYAEPIALTVKIDRKGLSAGKEKAAKKSAPAVLDLQGTNIIVLIITNNTTCTL